MPAFPLRDTVGKTLLENLQGRLQALDGGDHDACCG
jgi:hypothetical protein